MDSICDKYPEGTKLQRSCQITNAGAFIELEEGIDAFLHCDDWSWTKKVKICKRIDCRTEIEV